jgi:hyperosmotically inducible protein
MSKPVSRPAALSLLTLALAACDRVPGTLANFAMNDGATRNAANPRGVSDPYPSAMPDAPSSSQRRAGPLSPDALSDGAITARIKAEVLADPAMAGADVSVNTDGGVVVLTGTVKSQEQAAMASALAQRSDGVMRIDNHLSTPPQ